MTYLQLTGHLEDVMVQGATGMQLVERARYFLENLCRIQHRFAVEVSSLATSEKRQVELLFKDDKMEGTVKAWSSLFDQIHVLSQAHKDMVDAIAGKALKPLAAYYEEAHETIERHSKQILETQTVIGAEKVKVTAAQESCEECLSQLAKTKKSDKKKWLENRKNLLDSITSYKDKLREANAVASIHRIQKVPSVLASMQLEEEARILQVKQVIDVVQTAHHNFTLSCSSMVPVLQQIHDSVSPNRDMDKFVVSLCSKQTEKSSFTRSKYAEAIIAGSSRYTDVPTFPFKISTPPDLWNANPTNSNNIAHIDIFYSTLEEIFEYEQKTFACLNTTVPVTLDSLVQGIRLSKRGLQTPGLFQKEADSSAVQALKEQLESGNYRSCFDLPSPHIPSTLLLLWLKSLAHPLIPHSLFSSCMTLARQLDAMEDQEILRHLNKEDLYERVALNMRVVVETNAGIQRATVEYKGKTHFAEGHWLGLRLDKPNGLNNGVVRGKSYFICPNKHGLFCRPEAVLLWDEMESPSYFVRLHEVVSKLPRLNFDVIDVVLRLMNEAILYRKYNNLTAVELGRQFVPVFFRGADEVHNEMTQDDLQLGLKFLLRLMHFSRHSPWMEARPSEDEFEGLEDELSTSSSSKPKKRDPSMFDTPTKSHSAQRSFTEKTRGMFSSAEENQEIHRLNLLVRFVHAYIQNV